MTRFALPSYLKYLCTFAGALCVSEWLSFTAAIWVLAFFSFVALREYFSLVDIRLEDSQWSRRLRSGEDVEPILREWQAASDRFQEDRRPYLLYA